MERTPASRTHTHTLQNRSLCFLDCLVSQQQAKCIQVMDLLRQCHMQKLQIKLVRSLHHSIPTPYQPVLVLIIYCQVSGLRATRPLFFSHWYVRPEAEPRSPTFEVDALPLHHWGGLHRRGRFASHMYEKLSIRLPVPCCPLLQNPQSTSVGNRLLKHLSNHLLGQKTFSHRACCQQPANDSPSWQHLRIDQFIGRMDAHTDEANQITPKRLAFWCWKVHPLEPLLVALVVPKRHLFQRAW